MLRSSRYKVIQNPQVLRWRGLPASANAWSSCRQASQVRAGLYSRGFGGDTLNTAVYLARLDVKVDYLTALGDDRPERRDDRGLDRRRASAPAGRASARQAARPLHDPDRREGRAPVLPLARECGGAPPDGSAARRDDLLNSLTSYDIVYLSAITLSIYDESGRERLLAAHQARAPARHPLRLRHQFPRPRLARSGYRTRRSSARPLRPPTSCWPRPRICSRSIPARATDGLMARIPSRELVFRLAEPVSLLRLPAAPRSEVRAEPVTKPVVDTTAAGDSFAAAYIAARLGGRRPGRGRAGRPSPCRSRDLLSRRHHSSSCHAAKKRHRPATTRQATKMKFKPT